MAFSETNKLKICKILRINGLRFDQIIIRWHTLITPEIETQVIAEIDRWDGGVGTKFVSVSPNSANFGAEQDPELEKADIRRNIATLLFLDDDDWDQGSNESFEIERG